MSMSHYDYVNRGDGDHTPRPPRKPRAVVTFTVGEETTRALIAWATERGFVPVPPVSDSADLAWERRTDGASLDVSPERVFAVETTVTPGPLEAVLDEALDAAATPPPSMIEPDSVPRASRLIPPPPDGKPRVYLHIDPNLTEDGGW